MESKNVTWNFDQQDGYTAEVTGSEGVTVLVATKAKPNPDTKSPLTRAFYKNFLDVKSNCFYSISLTMLLFT